MEVVYISGPYRAATPMQVMKNIHAASMVSLRYWKQGYAVICPHRNTAFFDGEAPDSVWLNGDLEILRRCDIVVMMPLWKLSRGATEEHKLALELGKQIIYE